MPGGAGGIIEHAAAGRRPDRGTALGADASGDAASENKALVAAQIRGDPPGSRQRPERRTCSRGMALAAPAGHRQRRSGLISRAWPGERTPSRVRHGAEVFKEKLVERLSIEVLDAGDPKPEQGAFKDDAKIIQGIDSEKAKSISKKIRDEDPKCSTKAGDPGRHRAGMQRRPTYGRAISLPAAPGDELRHRCRNSPLLRSASTSLAASCWPSSWTILLGAEYPDLVGDCSDQRGQGGRHGVQRWARGRPVAACLHFALPTPRISPKIRIREPASPLVTYSRPAGRPGLHFRAARKTAVTRNWVDQVARRYRGPGWINYLLAEAKAPDTDAEPHRGPPL